MMPDLAVGERRTVKPTGDESQLEFGSLREGDAERVSELIVRMSDDEGGLRLRDKSADYYRWMYEQNPAGRAVVYSARLGERIVASFAVAPKTFEVDGQRVIVGKTMDMFTDPEWQGQGLMRICTDAVFREAAAAGIPGWYVTPSVNSYPIFTSRWGYREEFSLIYRLRVLRPRLLRRRLRLPAGTAVREVANFDDAATDLWERVRSSYRVAQVRDAAYLNWRYVENPDHYDLLELRREGHLVGLAVLGMTLRRGIPVGEVLELVHDPAEDDTLRLLVGAASVKAEARGCWLLQAWSLHGTRLDARLRRAGMRWRRGQVKFLLSPGFPGDVAADPDAWLLSQGDGNDV
jgi:GNAT superfamily N-acetyltransferase